MGRRVFTVVGLVAIASCAGVEPQRPPLPGPPASMTAEPGTTPQTGVVGKPVPEPPSVVVKDALGNPVAGVEVQFIGGDVQPSTVITSAAGRAKAAPWTLGTTDGEQLILARDRK